MVGSVLEGYNATVLAYGQTGSGKTHTMYGPPSMPAPSPQTMTAQDPYVVAALMPGKQVPRTVHLGQYT